MTHNHQHEVTRCECGGEQRHAPTLSPWEFHSTCQTCHHDGTVSWAHAAPPPVFVPAATLSQGALEFIA